MILALVFLTGCLLGSVTAIVCVGMCAAGGREDGFVETLDDIRDLPEVEA